MKYYQYDEYADCPNCAIEEEYQAYRGTARSEGEMPWSNPRNPCHNRIVVGIYRSCFKAHPIPWQELIDDTE